MPASVRPARELERSPAELVRALAPARAALAADIAAASPEEAAQRAALALCHALFSRFLPAPPAARPGGAALHALLDGFDFRLAPVARAITPDALGYLFERSVERKQMGAFYTQSDVADYIARATIVPWLLEELARARPDALATPAALLRERPERYLPAAMRHGAGAPLPDAIRAGLEDVAARALWDAPAPAEHALPSETWREALGRQRRASATLERLARGAPPAPGDLITLNLDALQLALDAAEHMPAADLLALWGALRGITVLDPTCGSGAFLVAAAHVLEPLYHACLRRMERLAAPEAERALAEAGAGPARAAWVLRAILAGNLFGVDIMPAAAEVCRLRLALELAARMAAPPSDWPPDAWLALAPNIRAGDALDPAAWPALFPDAVARGFDTVVGNPPYVVIGGERRAYARLGYRTAACGNLYALVVERALALLRQGGRLGVIVPVASVATDGMAALQALYAPHEQWHSHFAVRPARLFDDVDMNLTISLVRRQPGERFSTGYRRWTSGRASERPHLFATLAYAPAPRLPAGPYLPKLGSQLEVRLLGRLAAHGRTLSDYVTSSGVTLFYHSGGRYWRKALPAKLSSHYRPITVPAAIAPVVFGLLNSQLFYWYWIAGSNCMDVVAREVLGLPVFALERADPAPFSDLMHRLLAAYAAGRSTRVRRGRRIRLDETNFDVGRARPTVDAIDELLAGCYGLSAEELDFVRSYDLKYRAALLRT